MSQFLHGEQGAMICAAKTVQQVPDMDAKLYAATQTMEEARHVELYTVGEVFEFLRENGQQAGFRRQLFGRLVPTIRAIGLWGPRMQQAVAAMGMMDYAAVDLPGVWENDRQVAADHDALRARRRQVERVIGMGGSPPIS